jgi:hypothetical protein
MNNESFHVTLPSNSNLNLCPDNKPTDYTVVLGRPLDLQGDWEVKLNSIVIPHNWKTAQFDAAVHYAYLSDVPSGTSVGESLKVDYDATSTDSLQSFSINAQASGWSSFKPKTGRLLYTHSYAESTKSLGEDVASKLNTALGVKDVVKFTYDMETQAGVFNVPNGSVLLLYIHNSSKLAEYLGCSFVAANVSLSSVDASELSVPNFFLLTKTGKVFPARFKSIDQIYVYSDVIKNQIVGNVEAPLLATFAMPRLAFGEKHFHEFLVERYVPVASQNIHRIRVRLATGKGKAIPFATWSSEVAVELHFRRKHI